MANNSISDFLIDSDILRLIFTKLFLLQHTLQIVAEPDEKPVYIINYLASFSRARCQNVFRIRSPL